MRRNCRVSPSSVNSVPMIWSRVQGQYVHRVIANVFLCDWEQYSFLLNCRRWTGHRPEA